jgi:hypothetical protein
VSWLTARRMPCASRPRPLLATLRPCVIAHVMKKPSARLSAVPLDLLLTLSPVSCYHHGRSRARPSLLRTSLGLAAAFTIPCQAHGPNTMAMAQTPLLQSMSAMAAGALLHGHSSPRNLTRSQPEPSLSPALSCRAARGATSLWSASKLRHLVAVQFYRLAASSHG